MKHRGLMTRRGAFTLRRSRVPSSALNMLEGLGKFSRPLPGMYLKQSTTALLHRFRHRPLTSNNIGLAYEAWRGILTQFSSYEIAQCGDLNTGWTTDESRFYSTQAQKFISFPQRSAQLSSPSSRLWNRHVKFLANKAAGTWCRQTLTSNTKSKNAWNHLYTTPLVFKV